MSLKVTFELEDKDLKYFRDLMKKAKAAAKQKSESEIIVKARQVVEEVRGTRVPLFVITRLGKLSSLIDMLEDTEWSLQATERHNVASALSYFAEPEDLIPDEVPVIGYIDDAIMIELVVTELQHEIDAYDDFCRYRNDDRARGKRATGSSREAWLDNKRKLLTARMRRRRRSAGARRSTSSTRARLF